MHFLLYKKRSAKGANGLGDHCLAPTVVERRAHAFAEENVAYSDPKAAACRKRHALFYNRKRFCSQIQYLFCKSIIEKFVPCLTIL